MMTMLSLTEVLTYTVPSSCVEWVRVLPYQGLILNVYMYNTNLEY